MDLTLRLNRPQHEAIRALVPGTTVAIPWGRGVGKSWFLRRAWYYWIAQLDGQPRPGRRALRGVRIICLLPTLKQFKDVHSTLMLDELENEWSFLRGKVDRTTWTVTFPGGSWIKPFPATEHNSRTARGMRCDLLTTDEVDDIPREVYHSVVVPWFSEPWSLKMELHGGTPRQGRHGLLYRLHTLGLDSTEPSFRTVHATWRDAPGNVDPTTVRRAQRTTPEATFRREWECDFDSAEGLVYPFDAEHHIRAPGDIRFNEYIVGVDHGWNDPGVMLLIGIQGHGNDAVAWVLDERYEREKPNHEWDAQARTWFESTRGPFFCDRSRPDRINDLARAGVNAIGADNDIEAGVARVAELLFVRQTEGGRDWSRLYVAPHCTNTIREFGEYRRKRDPQDREHFLESIEDRNNHAMDALRYALVMRFGRVAGGRTEVPGA